MRHWAQVFVASFIDIDSLVILLALVWSIAIRYQIDRLSFVWVCFLFYSWLTLPMHEASILGQLMGYVTLGAFTGTTALAPYLWAKSLQLIWRSGTRRFQFATLCSITGVSCYSTYISCSRFSMQGVGLIFHRISIDMLEKDDINVLELV